MTLNYYTKEVYGQTMYYLAKPHDMHNWEMITGRKTITPALMDRMTSLTGVTFNRVFEAEN